MFDEPSIERGAELLDAKIIRWRGERGERADGKPQANVPSRNIVDLEAWARTDPPDFPWIIPHWFSWGPTLLAALGGMGKTMLLMSLATQLAARARFIGQSNERLRVLMWLCEDDADELHRRLKRACTHMGVDMRTLKDWLVIDARRGLENTLYSTEYGRPMWTPLIEELRQQVNDYHADVLMLDNIAQIYGADAMNQHHTTSFVNGINGLVLDRRFAPLLTGHTSRAQGSEYFGAAAWENCVRMRWFLSDRPPDEPHKDDEPEAQSAVRFLSKRKANYTKRESMRFRMDEGVLIPESEIFEEFANAPTEIVDKLYDKRAEATVLDGLRRMKAAGKDSSDSKNTEAYLPRQILEHGIAAGVTKSELERALRRLMMAGSIKRAEVGKYPNRTSKMGLVECTK